MGDGTALAERIAERRDGSGDPMAMVGELRRALVLVPVDAGGLWTAQLGGVRWICAFTGEESLARFARARDTGDGQETGRTWEFAEVRGARLLDEIIPAMGVPAGVAVDVADPDGAMLFPPARGIVPDAVAVDAPASEGAA
ncbi:SseB family protein [Streptomyces pristinaespiralis]|uniref:SseB family protein n=1 Tax=Streptomyces pristinaespiralis TaxID=38300 RepID=UPI0038393880